MTPTKEQIEGDDDDKREIEEDIRINARYQLDNPNIPCEEE